MFQKLRLKLTLINAFIMLTLFLLLIFSAYLFSKINIRCLTESVSQRIAADIQAGVINDLPHCPAHPLLPPTIEGNRPAMPPPPRPGVLPGLLPLPDFFFVKTSPSGDITFQSSAQPLAPEQLTTLVERTLQASPAQDKVTLEQVTYTYLKTPLVNSSGTLIIFHDLTPETNILRLVLTTLIAVGIFCSVLYFGTSFYMANRAMDPIKKAWQQQHDFLSDVSHELRTPLSVIQTNLDIIMGSPDETVASQHKWLNNIQEESIHMSVLVNSLLFLARADSKQQLLNKHLFCLKTAVAHAVATFEAMACQKRVSLELCSACSPEIYADEFRINQVIAILLDNAIRHTPAGGRIVVSLSPANNIIQLTVADSGEGIAAKHLDKIFDRFYQADESRNKGGSGLGLAIAKSIIESHDGTITVVSTLETGTTFTVQLPG